MHKTLFTILFLSLIFQAGYGRWGWQSHRFINDAAVDYLPPEMSFFETHRDYLSDHATDPDTDDLPGYYHYIDIDYYPEFFSGTLPHSWEGIIALYGQETVQDMGVIPWVIDWWLADLTSLMQSGDWDFVWQVAAELGHYVADAHQALHLTLNYNGQMTGNYGIHSRYETQLMNRHLDELNLADSVGVHWDSPIDSVFAWIEAIYPMVDQILEADNNASAVDPGYGDPYYDLMWDDLREVSIWSVRLAAVDLASIWHTAWINAGSPLPPGVGTNEQPIKPSKFELSSFPNPFNAQTNIRLQLIEDKNINLRILDLKGHEICVVTSGYHTAGEYQYTWEGLDKNSRQVDSGVYIAHISANELSTIRKLTIIK